MGNFRETTRCVLCLSGFAAVMVLMDVVAQIIMYSRVPDSKFKIIAVCIAGIIALAVPCCGWQGARDRSDSLLACFSCCSYFSGVVDCLVQVLGVFVVIIGVAFTNASEACAADASTPACDEEHRKKMLEACKSLALNINASIINSTLSPGRVENITAQADDLLNEQNCLDTMQYLGYGLSVLGVVVVVARCFDMCFHCASGFYGSKLRHMLLEDPQRDMTSDSDSA